MKLNIGDVVHLCERFGRFNVTLMLDGNVFGTSEQNLKSIVVFMGFNIPMQSNYSSRVKRSSMMPCRSCLKGASHDQNSDAEEMTAGVIIAVE